MKQGTMGFACKDTERGRRRFFVLFFLDALQRTREKRKRRLSLHLHMFIFYKRSRVELLGPRVAHGLSPGL